MPFPYPIALRGTTKDCLFLSFIMLLSIIHYVHDLGFYCNDWTFLGHFSISEDQSLPGLIRAFFDVPNNVVMRPVQIIYLSALYWLFGYHPFGYHLVNAAVLMSGIMLFYFVLYELNQNRLIALAVPMVYQLLPHYSTNRFWYAAFQANLSMTLYFLSLYCDLKMLRTRPTHLWGWKLVSLASLLGSVLAYEIFFPLFLLNLPLVWYRLRQLDSLFLRIRSSKKKLTVILGSNLLALMVVLVFKTLVTTRLSDYVFINRIKYLIKESLAINYGSYGFGLPGVLYKILRDYPNGEVFTLGGIVGLIIFGYLYQVATQPKFEPPRWSDMLKLIGLGLVIFGMGYAIFLTTYVGFTPTGIENRTAIAAAVGVAFSFVGSLGWISNFLTSSYLRQHLFCLLVSLLCTGGFLINNTIASFWVAAYSQQKEVIADIRQQFPSLPTENILMLDGVCPYIGPGTVFESPWDIEGVLRVIYRDSTLRGDVIRPNLKIKESGIYTVSYGHKFKYPYQKLFIYNFGTKKTYQLTDAKVARHYFAKFNPNYSSGCPEGYEGKGVPVW